MMRITHGQFGHQNYDSTYIILRLTAAVGESWDITTTPAEQATYPASQQHSQSVWLGFQGLLSPSGKTRTTKTKKHLSSHQHQYTSIEYKHF